jgi:hypothetical protein
MNAFLVEFDDHDFPDLAHVDGDDDPK